MMTFPMNTALILIDWQIGFEDASHGERSNPSAEEKATTLLHMWRDTGRPIFHIIHDSQLSHSLLRRGQPGYEIIHHVAPYGDEPLIVKRVNSGFIGTDLETQLHERGIDTVVICGLTTNHCVSTTTRMAQNLGFKTFLVGDATAAHAIEMNGELISAETIHRISLANLHHEFADVITYEQAWKMSDWRKHRHRASLIIVRDAHILLMYRNKNGYEYYCIPGGGVEYGETLEQAAIREAKEETGLDVVIQRHLRTFAYAEQFLLITEFSGELEVGGPEAERMSPTNIYRLDWIPLTDLMHTFVLTAPPKAALLQDIATYVTQMQ